MSQLRVVLVEDDPISRMDIKEMGLKLPGFLMKIKLHRY